MPLSAASVVKTAKGDLVNGAGGVVQCVCGFFHLCPVGRISTR